MKIRSALIIAGGMAAGVLLIAVSIHTPASFRTSATPVQKIVYDVPAIPDRTLVERSVSHYRMVGEDAVLAAYAAKVAAAQQAAPVDTVTPYERVAWTRVAVCEEGGWVGYAGYAYPDSLGISRVNWFGNGGGSDLSEDAQIMVAERIQTNPPDQDGCASW